MLVLTRRSGESILIGEEIRIRVLRASGSRVRIGIEAPPDVRIIREKAPPEPTVVETAHESVPRLHLQRRGVARNVAADVGRESAGARLAERSVQVE